MKFALEDWACMPERAHKEDAGIDIKSPLRMVLRPKDSIVINTGVHVEIPFGWVGLLKSKSGLNMKHGITSEGVIDAGYSGAIHCKLYNNSDRIYVVQKGDKITQLVVVPCDTSEVELVDEINGGERGKDGFGSTGR